MHTSRRMFLKTSTLVAGGTILFSNEIFAAKKQKGILGIQLYSIRDDMKKDPLGSLQKLARMGYRFVEHANYVDRKFYGYPVTEFKKILDAIYEMQLDGKIQNLEEAISEAREIIG